MKIRVTRAVTAPFRKLTGFGRRFASFNRGALLVVLAVILLGGMTTAEYLQQDAEQPPAISQQTADQEKPKEETPANIQTNAPPTDTPQPTTPKSTNPAASTPSTIGQAAHGLGCAVRRVSERWSRFLAQCRLDV